MLIAALLKFDEINKMYFGEMELSNNEIQRRIVVAKNFFRLLVPFFEKQKESKRIDPIMFAVMSDLYIEQLVEIYKDSTISRYDSWANEHAEKFAKDITESTINWKRGNQNNAFTETRAKEIALNESNLYFNNRMHQEKKKRYEYHVWRAHKDEATREAHYLSDGQIRRIDEPFDIGGYKMMHPMDATYGAPPEMIVNCRCIESFR